MAKAVGQLHVLHALAAGGRHRNYMEAAPDSGPAIATQPARFCAAGWRHGG